MKDNKHVMPTYPNEVGGFKVGDYVLYGGEDYAISKFTSFSNGNTTVSITGSGIIGSCSIQDIVHDTQDTREIARLMLLTWNRVYKFPLVGLNHPRLSEYFNTFFVQVCMDPNKDETIFLQFVNEAYKRCVEVKEMEVGGVKIFR